MDKLKPCPFCGEEAKLIEYRDASGCVWDAVQCQNCGAIGSRVLHRIHCSECAEDGWNHRTPLKTTNRRTVPENKPLTCEGCESEDSEEMCEHCSRAIRSDCYTRKTEGSEP